jgi:HEAT repeat protein
MRDAAVVALGTLLDRHKQPCHIALVRAMFDTSDAVRKDAAVWVLLLEDRMPPEATGLLLNYANHRNPEVRSDVMTMLAYTAGQNPIVRAVLRQATHDRSLMVRNNATAGLWKATKDLSAVVPHWLNLVESESLAETRDEDAELRKAVSIGAASQIHQCGEEHPRELIDTLLPLLADESPVLRRAAVRSLGALAAASEQCRRILKKQAVRKRVAPLLDDSDKAVRQNAAMALERLPE